MEILTAYAIEQRIKHMINRNGFIGTKRTENILFMD